MKNKKKPRNKREATKNAALDPKLNLRSRFELIDYDYLDKLSPKEKAWLNNFTEEYVNADFKHGGKRIHKKETKTKVVKATGKKREVDIAKQEAEHRNNARNRCILTKAKASGMYVEKDGLEDNQLYQTDPEKDIIDKIDSLKVLNDFEYTRDEGGEDS